MAAQAREHLCNRLLAIDDLARAHLLEPDGDLVLGELSLLGGQSGQLRVS
jgi:hypothetical protein